MSGRRLPLLLLSALAALSAAPTAFAAALPELPREYIDTTIDPAYDRPADIVVGAGGDLQLALDQVLPGQIIELQAGATFTGNFRLGNKTGADWIYIRSSKYQQLPAEGRRVRPEHASLMPKIVSPNSDPAIFTMFSTHNYRFVGIEVSTAVNNYNLILLGWGLPDIHDPMWMKESADTEAELPHHLTFDRCYIHSTSDTNWARTGILADGKYISVIGSHISNFKDGSDSQAIVAWQGTGPCKIVNNYLEGSGENIMFGGENIKIPGAIPSDIEVRGNLVMKRLDWLGSGWTVKNLFELKVAQRVLVSGNIFQNNWAAAQTGAAILFTPRNHGFFGGDPYPYDDWSVVQDVTFENNIVRSTGQGFLISGEDYVAPSEQTKRILIRNNVIENVSKYFYSHSRFFKINSGEEGGRPVLDLTISHNLFLHARPEIGYAGVALEYTGYQAENIVFDDNILTHGDWGVPTLSGWDQRALNYSFRNNAIIRKPGEFYYDDLADQSVFVARYGTENFNVDQIGGIGFVSLSSRDYRLKASSPYKNAATDGTDVGPDIDTLNANIFLYCSHPMERSIENLQVLTPSEIAACQRITIGTNTVVSASGELTVLAGERVTLEDGFAVEQSGKLEVAIESPYPL